MDALIVKSVVAAAYIDLNSSSSSEKDTVGIESNKVVLAVVVVVLMLFVLSVLLFLGVLTFDLLIGNLLCLSALTSSLTTVTEDVVLVEAATCGGGDLL